MSLRPITPKSARLVSNASVNGVPAGVVPPSVVPPSRSSTIPPAVTKIDPPNPSFQNRRGRTTARRYPGRSAHPSLSTSA